MEGCRRDCRGHGPSGRYPFMPGGEAMTPTSMFSTPMRVLMTSRSHSLMVGVAATIALLGGSTPARAEGAGNGPAAECRQAANRLRAYDQSAVNSGGHAAQGNGKAEERQVAAARLLTCGEMGGEEAATTLSATR